MSERVKSKTVTSYKLQVTRIQSLDFRLLVTCNSFTCLLFIALFFTSCGVRRNVPVHQQPPRAQQQPVAPTLAQKQQDLVAFSKQFLRTPFQMGGRGPNTFDCSGFTSFVFREFGYTLNPTSAMQYTQFPAVRNKRDLRVGDLVFFEGRTRNGRVGHVGIVTETRPNGYFRFIHATVSAGVMVSSSTCSFFGVRYLRGGRVLQDNPNYTARQQTQTAQTQAQTPPTPTQQTHTVQAGDTLFSISRRYNTTVEQLRQWNPQLGDVLRIGEVLVVRR